VAQKFWAAFSTVKGTCHFWQLMGRATFWAISVQAHLVTLLNLLSFPLLPRFVLLFPTIILTINSVYPSVTPYPLLILSRHQCEQTVWARNLQTGSKLEKTRAPLGLAVQAMYYLFQIYWKIEKHNQNET
jgi:hypothetical protein